MRLTSRDALSGSSPLPSDSNRPEAVPVRGYCEAGSFCGGRKSTCMPPLIVDRRVVVQRQASTMRVVPAHGGVEHGDPCLHKSGEPCAHQAAAFLLFAQGAAPTPEAEQLLAFLGRQPIGALGSIQVRLPSAGSTARWTRTHVTAPWASVRTGPARPSACGTPAGTGSGPGRGTDLAWFLARERGCPVTPPCRIRSALRRRRGRPVRVASLHRVACPRDRSRSQGSRFWDNPGPDKSDILCQACTHSTAVARAAPRR